MAKTTWYYNQRASIGSPVTTGTEDELMGDIFEAGEITEYTILKVIGAVELTALTALAADMIVSWAMTVEATALGVGEVFDINGTPGSGAQDSAGFLMHRGATAIDSGITEDVHRRFPVDINTRRVVREGESLSLYHIAGNNDAAQLIWWWFRMLILTE